METVKIIQKFRDKLQRKTLPLQQLISKRVGGCDKWLPDTHADPSHPEID